MDLKISSGCKSIVPLSDDNEATIISSETNEPKQDAQFITLADDLAF